MQSPSVHRALLMAAGVCGALGVLAGTFAAHLFKERLSSDMLTIFETGVRYHLIHAVAVLAVAALGPMLRRPRRAAIAGWLMLAGVVVFSGSLYALALTEYRRLGMVTPLGGISLIAGWLMLVAAGVPRGEPA